MIAVEHHQRLAGDRANRFERPRERGFEVEHLLKATPLIKDRLDGLRDVHHSKNTVSPAP